MKTRNVAEHLKLMTDISEVSALLAESPDLQGFLDRAVGLVADHLVADVCSIYLYDEETQMLSLAATRGLDPAAVGHMQLKLGEGLVGTALKELRPICVANASHNPHYRFFPDSGEESFDAFLAVPIQRGIEKVGVLVAQRDEKHLFSNTEILAMRALTAQLATAIETTRVMLQISQPSLPSDSELVDDLGRELFVQGRSASPGYALAKSVIFARHPVERILNQNRELGAGAGSAEDLNTAIERTSLQLEHFQLGLGDKLPEVASLIFESHIMMLKDRSFTGQMFDKIESGAPASRAIAEVAGFYVATFEGSTHDYMREKARDVEDLALRLLSHLSDSDDDQAPDWRGRVVIVRELLPSDILRITLEDVAGIVLASGGLTSHVTILVRSLNIPMVIVEDLRLLSVPDGEMVLLDADIGNVYINPPETVLETFGGREQARETVTAQASRMVDQTLLEDGGRVTLLANINLLSELDLALKLKAEGVGLYRTEFPFLIRQALPSEDEQFAVYARLLDRMQNQNVTIRTLDAGGDKVLAYFDDAGEPNPALGLRSTRLTLRYRDIFDQQIRAILRAGMSSDTLRIMFPMICSLDEFIEARDCVLVCVSELESELGIEIKRPKIGMMVELPAVVEIIDDFAHEADFFSTGTNDFIQYMLAVDRTNARVADYYCSHHPAVLRGLKRVADAAIRHNIDCAVCGEMAHDVRYIPFFVGIGIRRLSVDPHYLPEVQQCVMSWSSVAASAYANEWLTKSRISEIDALLAASLTKSK
jgi:phosphotransferase system enzyme I (PtsP)